VNRVYRRRDALADNGPKSRERHIDDGYRRISHAPGRRCEPIGSAQFSSIGVQSALYLEKDGSIASPLSDPVEAPQKPWRQLAFVLGEVGLSLISGGVMFVVISRVSGPKLLGVYALALAWLGLFQGVSNLGIPDFILREAGAHGRRAANQVVHAMLLGLGSGLVAICLMLVATRLLGYTANLVQVISVASLALIPGFLNMACRSVFVARRQMHLPFLTALVELTIVMSISPYLLATGHGAIALMIVLVVSKVTSAAIAVTLLFGRVFPERPPIDLAVLMRTARTVLTFGIGNLIGVTMIRVNMIMVSLWVGVESLGHFAAATKIMEVGLIGPQLFSQLLLTRIAYSFTSNGDRDPNRFGAWYEFLFALAVPLGVGLWVFAGLILETLFGAAFADAVWILRILTIFMMIETADTVMSVILKAANRQREDVICLGFNLLINVVLNLTLLPILGPIGSAIGRAAGAGVSAVPRYYLIARILTPVNWIRFAHKPALVSVGVGSICYLLLGEMHPVWLLLFYAAAVPILLKAWSSFSFSTLKDMMSFPSAAD
jgi:O-antigen/teichoic acid export membrane protein